ncbi:hypothetical protein [Streptomyces sp. I05A-00742]|uniref:hypothetical protein n=1 Tax=Streptomyces sp. I05A-00742 TaxID=2732853 RepID=UPI001487ECF9|nr:hypothetical protein [Streptomyces sp. I05A-00742]
MKLRFLGKNSTPGDSPTLYATDQCSYVIQGWKVFADDLLMRLPEMLGSEALRQMSMPDYETCIEVPKSSITALLEEDSGPDHSRTA